MKNIEEFEKPSRISQTPHKSFLNIDAKKSHSKPSIDLFLSANWKKTILTIIFFFILFELFLIQDFNFFWEDYFLLGLSEYTPEGYTRVYNPSISSLNLTNEILDNFLNIQSTFSVSRHGQNVYLILFLFGSLFKDNISLYWTLALFCLSYLIILMLLLFKRVNSLSFGVLAVISYISFPQVWQLIISSSWMITSLIMHILTVSSLVLFYFFYQKKLSNFKTICVFSLIVILSRFSMLMKQEGRIVFLIILTYLIIFDRKRIRELKNILLLFALFLTSFPFSTGVNSFLLSSESKTQISVTNLFSGLKVLSFIYGNINLFGGLFIAIFTLYLLINIGKKTYVEENKDKLKLIVFSAIWFIYSVMIPILGKGISSYGGPQSWLIIDFFYTLFPFSIFLFSGLSLMVDLTSHKNKKKILTIILLIVIISVSIKVVALNRFVGAYNDQIIGSDTVTDFLDSQKINNSKILFPFDGTGPLAQVNTPTNYVNSLPLTDLKNVSLLDLIKSNFSNLYIISSTPIEFSEQKRISTIQTFKPRTNSIYSKLKKRIKGESTILFYLYKLS